MKSCTKCKRADVQFYKRSNRPGLNYSECKECMKARMGNRHQKHKDALVAELGGKCSRCGYNKSSRVLDFHHVDPTTKKYEIADFLSRNLERLREEAAKCILLCPNCHREKHLRLW